MKSHALVGLGCILAIEALEKSMNVLHIVVIEGDGDDLLSRATSRYHRDHCDGLRLFQSLDNMGTYLGFHGGQWSDDGLWAWSTRLVSWVIVRSHRYPPPLFSVSQTTDVFAQCLS